MRRSSVRLGSLGSNIRRLLLPLALAVCALPAGADDHFDAVEPDFDLGIDTAVQAPGTAPPARTERAAQIDALLVRADAARSRGDVQAQIVALRQAHEIAEGRNSVVANLYASALALIGDEDGARRVREDILATDLPPPQTLLHAATLAIYAANLADFGTANKWLAIAESVAKQFGQGQDDMQAQFHHARSVVLVAQGKYREGEDEGRLAASAIRRAIEGMGSNVRAQQRYKQNLIDADLARALFYQGKIAESEWILRNTLNRSVRDTGAHSVPTAKFALQLAQTQLRQGRPEQALRHASDAVTTFEQQQVGESSGPMASALLMIGWSQAMAGRFDASQAAFERRARNWAGAYGAGYGSGSVVWGYAMIRTGRAEAALPMLRAHYEEALRRSPTGYTTQERAAMYAYALLRAGRAADARPLFASSVPWLTRNRLNRRAADRADAFVETISNWTIEGYLEFLSRDAESGDARAIAAMFRLADVARGSSVQRALALASTRARIDDPKLARIARLEQDLGNRQSALTRIVEELLARPRERQPLNTISDIQREIVAAAQERESLRDEIAAKFPQYAQLIEPRPTIVPELRKLLSRGEVVVATYSAHDRTYVWAIPKAGPLRFTTAALGSGEIATAVRQLRSALDIGGLSLADFPAYDTAAAFLLYRQLFKPVESAWAQAEALIVVPHGALGQLPFALLPTASAAIAPGASFEGYRQVPWLIRKLAIFQLPSVSALAALRTGLAPSAAAPGAFVGFGDPQFGPPAAPMPAVQSGIPLRNLMVPFGGDPAKPWSNSGFSHLPQLPDTALELEDIASILKPGSTEVMLGLQASETRVKEGRLDRYRVLMFATHGLVPGDFDGLTQPALALSNPELTGEKDVDGLLTLDEILGLKLNTDWVVLSACNTAAGDGAGSEAVSGLGRAFFYAGARALLVSNWPVETVSARLITTDLFRRQNENSSLARAEVLRRTLLNLIDRGEAKDASGRTRHTYAHPMFWAPFSLVGDGGGGK